MNNDKLKFVVDSRSFDGSCVTTMSDGIHGDYHHETLEELGDREKNPYLTAVSGRPVGRRNAPRRKLSAPRSVRLRKKDISTTWMSCPPSAIPGISFSWESLIMRTSTGSASGRADATSRDSAPLPRQERNWNGRWTTITGTLPSKETS
ncbi:hypothetical protein PARMER_03849 [Parabacteroides merdae ATCC 43184]|nr:hypothetical protein PARMER_03849 [Parabacteroides merdae ATCC 43184]